MLLYIMIGQNPKNKKTKKLHFKIWDDVMLEYVCIKKSYGTTYEFFKILSFYKNDLKSLWNLYIVLMKHCESI
jgi:hypothetical protein